ncbi:B3GALNT2 [Branchiostoma lanceolatum]|uniref:Hexosyltransferase n=1 Tax=Branchiostoma lanceolatum TaxID=7740 RepID=A0A8J9ZRI8_BRALA|nr:B3GALNT2 [Branchiostoma lanceolatum]
MEWWRWGAVLAAVVSLSLFRDFIFSSFGLSSVEEAKPEYDIVIGILSARENFEQRRALRATWVGYIQQHPDYSRRVLVKFIVGSKPCPVPPPDRLDPFTCQKLSLSETICAGEVVALSLASQNSFPSSQQQTGPVETHFTVHHPVVITKLGVLGGDIPAEGVRVRLVDSAAKEDLLSVNFTSDDPGLQTGGNTFKAVQNYVLPKGFQGTITVESLAADNELLVTFPLDQLQVNNKGGVLQLTKTVDFMPESGYLPPHTDVQQHTAATFMYRVFEPEFLEQAPQDLRAKDWTGKLGAEQQNLETEVERYGDILLVEEEEFYRNLPRKKLGFYKWVTENVRFNFTLKTDDDCFIDVDKIATGIETLKLREKSRVWWSRFRSGWAVEHHGKWAEQDYPSPVYPAFACGAGNMLSADLVSWLAKNAHELRPYQGEDVSLGIWLAALGPNLICDHSWQCEEGCTTEMYSSPELQPTQLMKMWSNLQRCGNACQCT